MLGALSMRLHPFVATLALVASLAIAAPAAHAQNSGASSSTPPPVSATAVATAGSGEPTGQGQAVAHYERGRAYYAAGRYRAAATELETAIRLDPSGFNLYFDLGLVYERLGRVDSAIDAYRHYRARLEDAAERERAERIIRRLQGARVELAEVGYRPGRADAAFWVTTSLALASLTVGAVLLGVAIRTDGEVARLRMMGANDMVVRPVATSAENTHIAADVTLVGSLAFAVSATVLFFARPALPRNTPTCLTATAGPGGAGFQLRF